MRKFSSNKMKKTVKKDIESDEKLVLTDKDRDLFLSLMENPPEPNQALKSAMRRFKEK